MRLSFRPFMPSSLVAMVPIKMAGERDHGQASTRILRIRLFGTSTVGQIKADMETDGPVIIFSADGVLQRLSLRMTQPVVVNVCEARISLPWQDWKFDLDGRLQDDQPRPHKGFSAAIDLALRTAL